MDSSHISALQSKHASLEQAIRQEMSRPVPDDSTLLDLKRRKLKLKDELSQS